MFIFKSLFRNFIFGDLFLFYGWSVWLNWWLTNKFVLWRICFLNFNDIALLLLDIFWSKSPLLRFASRLPWSSFGWFARNFGSIEIPFLYLFVRLVKLCIRGLRHKWRHFNLIARIIWLDQVHWRIFWGLKEPREQRLVIVIINVCIVLT